MRPKPLEYVVRPLERRDVSEALAVHASRWKDPHLVVNSKILNRLIASPSTHDLQKSIWVKDPQSGLFRLTGLVNVCRFSMDHIDPSSLRVKRGEDLPTDYYDFAHSIRGKAAGCFIISSAHPSLLREGFEDRDTVERLIDLMGGRANRLVRAVKADAPRHGLEWLTAVSTPALIEKKLKLPPNTEVTVEQVVHYAGHYDCPAMVTFHGGNGAELIKVIARPDGHNGRPLSENLGGGGAIAFMVYPYGKGEELIARRPEHLVSVRRPIHRT